MDLINSLIKDGWLKTPRIIEAFRKIKRADFMLVRQSFGVGGPDDIKQLAEVNEAMPIGQGQTISQPLTVAFMFEQLQPKPGENILDIGCGSGWTTTLLAYIVSQKRNPKLQATNSKQITNFNNQNSKGKVIAIEIIPKLKDFGEQNTAKYNFVEKRIAQFICADGSKGYKKEAPFDKILASAAGKKVPQVWKDQLKIGGKIVCPIESSIFVITKKSEKDFEQIEHPGFIFVPLVEL